MVISLAVFFSLIPGSAVIKAEEEVKTTFPVYTLHKSGSDRENFVIVIMGDGYTASQREQFVEDATKKAQGMLTWSPIRNTRTASIFTGFRRFPMNPVSVCTVAKV